MKKVKVIEASKIGFNSKTCKAIGIEVIVDIEFVEDGAIKTEYIRLDDAMRVLEFQAIDIAI